MSTNDEGDPILVVFLALLFFSILIAIVFQSVPAFMVCAVATAWVTRKCIK